MELSAEDLDVGGSYAKADESADVPEDRFEDHRIDLREVLVGKHQPDAILAKLGEHGGEALCREGVELIKVKEEIPPGRLGPVGPAEAGRSDMGDEEGA